MSVHTLKSAPEPFRDVWSGEKHAEYRNNDRGFAVGDLLILKEYVDGNFTGHLIVSRVTHVQDGYGIPDGFVVLSINVCCLVTPYDVTPL